MLHPGYKPPDRKTVGGKLLNEVYLNEMKDCDTATNRSNGVLSIDGWENVNNEPIICASVTTTSGCVILVDAIDTTGIQHISENLYNLAKKKTIKKTEENFKCKIKSFVTDNAHNMKKMSKEIQTDTNNEIIAYGCGAHMLSLLSKDISKIGNFTSIQQHIVQIIKFFRNHHLPKAYFESAGGTSLVLPIEVQWNTYCDAIESYIKNWSSLASTVEKYRNDPAFDRNLCKHTLKYTIYS